jgi:predicted RNA-binding protein with RPS1 domain
MAVTAGDKPTSINDLEPKIELTGVVKKVELFGAFVDVGVGHDGLLHISQLSSGHVRNVTDVVKEGDSVTVWVMAIDREKGRFNLTMVRPAAVSWDDIKPGSVLTGKVTRVERFGAFVDVGAERAGRIHVSELSTEYVKNPEDIVKVGDEVRAKVLNVNPADAPSRPEHQGSGRAGPCLSARIRAEEAVPNAIEWPAPGNGRPPPIEGSQKRDRQRRGRDKKQRGGRLTQEDIMARTLQPGRTKPVSAVQPSEQKTRRC